MRKAQVAVEYLMIFGFILLALIPTTVVYYTYTQTTNDEVVGTQLSKISKEIIESAEQVFYQGEPSQTTIRVFMPKNLVGSDVGNNEISMRYKVNKGHVVQISDYTPINITGTLPEKKGIFTVKVKAFDGFVNVSYK